VALLLRSAEIQPVFGRFVTEWHSPFTPLQTTGNVLLPGRFWAPRGSRPSRAAPGSNNSAQWLGLQWPAWRLSACVFVLNVCGAGLASGFQSTRRCCELLEPG